VQIEAVPVFKYLLLDSFAHFLGKHLARFTSQTDELLKLLQANFIAIEVDICQLFRFLEVHRHELTILLLLFVVNQVNHCGVLKQARGRRYQKVFHRNSSVH